MNWKVRPPKQLAVEEKHIHGNLTILIRMKTEVRPLFA